MTNDQIIALAEQACKAHATLIDCKRGEYLFKEGDDPEHLFIIESGIVEGVADHC